MSEACRCVLPRIHTTHINRLRIDHNVSIDAYKSEIERLNRRQTRIETVLNGYSTETLKNESNKIVDRLKELEVLLSGQKEAPILLHPNMAERYRKEVTNLIGALRDEGHRHEAIELIRASSIGSC